MVTINSTIIARLYWRRSDGICFAVNDMEMNMSNQHWLCRRFHFTFSLVYFFLWGLRMAWHVLWQYDMSCSDSRIKYIFIGFLFISLLDINLLWMANYRFAASFCGIHVFIKGFIIHCLANWDPNNDKWMFVSVKRNEVKGFFPSWNNCWI